MTWSDTASSCDAAKRIAEITTQWMSELGADGLAETTAKAALAFDAVVNASKIAGTACALMGVRNSEATAEASAITAVKAALGPIGWGNIALAAGAAAATAALTGTLLHCRMRANLSQPSGVEAVKQAVGNVV